MYLEEIEEVQKEIQSLTGSIKEKNADLKIQSDKVESLMRDLEEAQSSFGAMRVEVQKTNRELTGKKARLEELYSKEAAREREEAILELISQQKKYEDELEAVIADFIERDNTGLTFEKKKDPKDLARLLVTRENGRRFDDLEIEARGSRQRWNRAMRAACEAHYDKKPVDKYERLRGLEAFVQHPRVAEMIL